MHHAPAIEYSLATRSVALRWIVGLWAPGLMAMMCWSWLAFPDGGWKWLGLALVAAAVVVAVSTRQRIAHGSLVWDGLNWAWTDGGDRLIGEVALVLDLQRYALLSFEPAEPAQRRVWMLLGGRGPRWFALRRALYAMRSGPGRDAKGPGTRSSDDFRRN